MKEETKQKLEDIKTDVSVRWYGFKWNLKNKATNTIKWCEEHPELAIAAIPVALTVFKGVSNVSRSIDRKIDLKKEEDFKSRTVWDASLGKWHELKRPLKPREVIEIDQRKANGESYASILDSMRLLKY